MWVRFPPPALGLRLNQQGRELGGFVLPPLQPTLTTLWRHCAVIVPL